MTKQHFVRMLVMGFAVPALLLADTARGQVFADLKTAQTIYVAPMPQDLQLYIIAELAKKGPYRVSLDKEQADLWMTGSASVPRTMESPGVPAMMVSPGLAKPTRWDEFLGIARSISAVRRRPARNEGVRCTPQRSLLDPKFHGNSGLEQNDAEELPVRVGMSAAVYIVPRRSNHVLWATETNDQSGWIIGNPSSQAQIARNIVGKLRKAAKAK